MKELIKLKIQPYTARMKIIEALNEAGYGTRIEEVKEYPYSFSTEFYVIIYEKAMEGQVMEQKLITGIISDLIDVCKMAKN